MKETSWTLTLLGDGMGVILTPSRYPEYALDMELLGGEVKPTLTNLKSDWEPAAPSVAVVLTAAPDGSGAHMVSAATYRNRYFYVECGGGVDDAHPGDGGQKSYWQFDPPLPADVAVQAYEGWRFQPRDRDSGARTLDVGGVTAALAALSLALVARG